MKVADFVDAWGDEGLKQTPTRVGYEWLHKMGILQGLTTELRAALEKSDSSALKELREKIEADRKERWKGLVQPTLPLNKKEQVALFDDAKQRLIEDLEDQRIFALIDSAAAEKQETAKGGAAPKEERAR